MNKSIDVVYPLGRGSNWLNNELKYSLRSLQKYGKGIRNIYIVGECPFWIHNVIHVEANDPFGPENADGNITHKVLQACQISELSDDFLFINDDHLLLQSIEVAKIPAYNKGTIEDFIQGKDMSGLYLQRLERTLKILRRKKLPTLHYDCHTPIVINKHEFPKVMANFDYHLGYGYGMKSIYANSLHLESPFLTDLNIKRYMSEAEIMELVNGKTHMAYNDKGLNHNLMVFLEKRFSQQSKYEQMDTERISLLKKADKWLENPSSYSEGAQLYVALGKNKHLLGMVKADKVGRTQKAIQKELKVLVQKAKDAGDLKSGKKPVSKAPKTKTLAPKKTNGKIGQKKTVIVDKNPHVKYDDLPEELKLIFNRNQELTKELTPLHEKMKNLGDDASKDAERQKLAEDIVKMDKERKDNWLVIDTWWNENGTEGVKKPKVEIKASGKLSKEEIDAIEDPAVKKESELLRIKANKSYIQRYKSSEDTKKQEQVKLRQDELKAWNVK